MSPSVLADDLRDLCAGLRFWARVNRDELRGLGAALVASLRFGLWIYCVGRLADLTWSAVAAMLERIT